MPTSSSSAATAPGLGTAASFAVLAGSTVTNDGDSVIDGDLGVSPGTAVTGFPPGQVVAPGAIHAGDPVAAQAQADALVAYNNIAGQPCDTDLTSQDLGGLLLTAGVYCFNTSAQLTGTLTLVGDTDDVFIFQIGSTLTTASSSRVEFSGEVNACNVFFQVGSSATIGTGTTFAGTILANTSITANTEATVDGRVLALNGAVTLDDNLITAPDCTTGGTDTGATDGSADAGTTDGTDVGATDGTDAGATDGATDAGAADGSVDAGTTDGATDAGATAGGAIDGVGVKDNPITAGAATRTELARTGANATLALIGTLAVLTGLVATSLSRARWSRT